MKDNLFSEFMMSKFTSVDDGLEDSGGVQTETSSSAIVGEQVSFQDSIPEDLKVFVGEGEEAVFNLEASSNKLLESYNEIQNANNAPENIEDYQIDSSNIAENFNFDDFKADEANQAFLKSAHAAGLSNSQLEKLLNYGLNELLPNIMQGNQQLNESQAIEHMKTEVWGDAQDYIQNMKADGTAFK